MFIAPMTGEAFCSRWWNGIGMKTSSDTFVGREVAKEKTGEQNILNKKCAVYLALWNKITIRLLIM
jgi:hypothetical protein